jgi:hypothetical protein
LVLRDAASPVPVAGVIIRRLPVQTLLIVIIIWQLIASLFETISDHLAMMGICKAGRL